jgi:hypothetical protein
MSAADTTATIVAALIGAVSGSVGATLISIWFNNRGEKISRRRNLINRYFLQLQDVTESLFYRLDSISSQSYAAAQLRRLEALEGTLAALSTPHARGNEDEARSNREEIYYEQSMLYTLACFLACKRIMLLDGIYSQIEQLRPDVGRKLKNELFNIDRAIESPQFRTYDKLALAEAVMERAADGSLRTSTYLQFIQQYEKSDRFRKSLDLAREYVKELRRLFTYPLYGALSPEGARLEVGSLSASERARKEKEDYITKRLIILMDTLSKETNFPTFGI